jgi:DNA repair exonuclease SbcCD ATPase subunit
MSARAAAHRATSSLSISTTLDADARAETVALIDDLKERLHKADTTSEQYRKQAEVLQSRLDEALKEQAKFEERTHENEEQIESLRNEKREAARQMREMEAIYEAERSSMLKEKEEMTNREEEMQTIINRLKETLNQRNAEDEYRPARQCKLYERIMGFCPYPVCCLLSDNRQQTTTRPAWTAATLRLPLRFRGVILEITRSYCFKKTSL